MKISGNQRRLYLLALVLLALTFALCVLWGFWREPGPEARTASPTATPGVAYASPTPAASPAPDADAASATVSDAVLPGGETARTIVYYQDNYGYLVPVTKTVPMEDGIAKATLNLMVQSAYNDMEAARLGLRTVIPEDASIELDINDKGLARIDLGEKVLSLADAQQESNMVAAIVQTLTEFPTVEKVRFLVNGQERATLTHGTPISGEFTRGLLNLESAANGVAPDVAKTVTLYFPGENSALVVPVTRMVYGSDDLNTAVLELAKGPGAASPLEEALPPGCGLIDVSVDHGVATINFTKEFIQLAENSDGGRAALRALTLTCSQFKGIKEVRVEVEGEPYDPGESTLSVPTFVNDAGALAEEFIRTQTASILETE